MIVSISQGEGRKLIFLTFLFDTDIRANVRYSIINLLIYRMNNSVMKLKYNYFYSNIHNILFPEQKRYQRVCLVIRLILRIMQFFTNGIFVDSKKFLINDIN